MALVIQTVSAEEFRAIARNFRRLDGRIGISERQLRRLCRRFGYPTPRHPVQVETPFWAFGGASAEDELV
jgi:hypothetical protein